MDAKDFRAKLGLPKAGKVVELSADEFRKAGDAKTALRLREGLEARAKREAALKRTHVNAFTLSIIGKPPNYNAMLKNPWTCAELKAEYSTRVTEAWNRSGKPVLGSPYKYRVHLVRPTRRGDRSNLTHGAIKTILDCLTNLKAIAGDAFDDDVSDGPHTQELGKGWLTVFTLEKVAPSGEF